MSDWIDKLYPRHLKNAGSKNIQDAFAKALTELTGEEYSVSVDLIDFEPRDGGWEHDEAKITISARRIKDNLEEVRNKSKERKSPN